MVNLFSIYRFISVLLNLALILIICFQIPQERNKFIDMEQKVKKNNVSSLNLMNLQIFFLILISLGINILLNLK